MLSLSERKLPEEAISTVVLIVHGVGDHTPGDILEDARKGFLVATDQTGKIETIELSMFPQLDGTIQDQQVLRVINSTNQHLVIPLLWSHVHSRAVENPEKRIVSVDLTKLVSPYVYRLAIDAFRCIGKAQKGGWQVAVLTSAFFLLSA